MKTPTIYKARRTIFGKAILQERTPYWKLSDIGSLKPTGYRWRDVKFDEMIDIAFEVLEDSK